MKPARIFLPICILVFASTSHAIYLKKGHIYYYYYYLFLKGNLSIFCAFHNFSPKIDIAMTVTINIVLPNKLKIVSKEIEKVILASSLSPGIVSLKMLFSIKMKHTQHQQLSAN